MSFRFCLGRAQVKHFKTALQTLNRIGGELLVEAVPEQLVLRSINTAKSAFLSVTYFSRFFDSYEIYDTTVVQTIVLSKNALAIFRSQKINQIEFTLDNAAAKLQATVHTDEGLIKRYAFNCLDGEVLQATVDHAAYPTMVIAEASELEKLLSSFQHTLDEITLIANPLGAAALANGHKACEIRSFVDPLKGGQESALMTSLTLDTRSVFTSYSHSSPLAADVTFNVKDFRAMTALCTALGADVALWLQMAGAPLVVEPHFRGLREGAETDFQAMLVLSTLTDSQLGPEHHALQQQQQQQQDAQEEEEQQQLQPQPQPQQQHHTEDPQRQPWITADAEAEAEPPSPYDGTGRGGTRATSSGRGRGAAAPAPPSTGRGRRRLPSRQEDSSAGGLAATVAARGAYAAAAAAEGLPVADGGGCGGAPPGAADPLLSSRPGLLGPAAAGGAIWPGAPAEDSRDGLEDDIPARRTGRPPRYDPARHAAFAIAAPSAGQHGDFPVVAAAAAADTSLLHPPPHSQPPVQGAAFPHSSQRQGQGQPPLGLQWPSDPRVRGGATGGCGDAHAATGHHSHHHHHSYHQEQQQYLQFPRGPAAPLADTAGPTTSAHGAAGPQPDDSQDPEGLPGMLRSPYGRQQPRGQQVPGAAGNPSFGGSYSVTDLRLAQAAAAEAGAGQHHPPNGGIQGGDLYPAAAVPPPPQQQQQRHGPQADLYAAAAPQPWAVFPQAGVDGQMQQQQQPQELLPRQQHAERMVVDHAEMFGEDDGDGGDGGYYDVNVEDDDDDEELPATPPEQLQTRSLGAGVLGGLGGDQAAG